MTTQKTMNAVIKKRFKVSTSVKLKHPFMLLFSTDMLHRNLTIVLVQRSNQRSSKSIFLSFLMTWPMTQLFCSACETHYSQLFTVGCTVKRLHKFTDGYSAQYKSCHCMGSYVLLPSNDFGYPAQRNYFET